MVNLRHIRKGNVFLVVLIILTYKNPHFDGFAHFSCKHSKESISLTLAILCAIVCFSDNIDTITLIFCKGNPDANLLTKN